MKIRRATFKTIAMCVLCTCLCHSSVLAAEPMNGDQKSAENELKTVTDVIQAVEKSTGDVILNTSKTIDQIRSQLRQSMESDSPFMYWFFDTIMAFLTLNILGWPLWQYLLSLLILVLAFTLRHFIARWLVDILTRITSRTKTSLDDELVVVFKTLIPPLRLAILLIGIYFAFTIFLAGQTLPIVLQSVKIFLQSLFYLVMLGNIGWAFCRLTDSIIDMLYRITTLKDTLLDKTFVPIARSSAKTFFILILTLQGLYYFEFGALVSSLLAAAGVSGLAIGLAAQDTIKNFFGSVVLLLDRPFSVGDWVIAGGTEGIVESVGFRSTKIRTFGKTLITIPNSQIVDRDIENVSRRGVRRISFTLGVTYDTTPSQMQELIRRLRDLLRNDDEVWPNTILVRFTEFGGSSLNIFIYYFSKTTVWDEHLALREKINLKIMQIVEDLGLEIAFPTQTIYLHGQDALKDMEKSDTVISKDEE